MVVVLGFMTIVRGIIFQEQDLVIITVVRIVIAASVNFPMLILSVYWPGPPLRLKKWISPHRKTIRGAGIPL